MKDEWQRAAKRAQELTTGEWTTYTAAAKDRKFVLAMMNDPKTALRDNPGMERT